MIDDIRITGVMFYYHFVCNRKLWYFSHNISMEQNNDDVAIGKLIDEKSYDRELQGKDGLEYIEVNAYNKLVKSIDSVKAIPGKELLLSIDSRLQDQMAKTLEGKKGAFIAMDVKTGEVITIISNPEYSLNRFAGKFTTEEWNSLISDPLKPLYNRTISSSFPPGSIFKVIPAMGFLQNGIDPDMTIYDPGYYQLGKFTD